MSEEEKTPNIAPDPKPSSNDQTGDSAQTVDAPKEEKPVEASENKPAEESADVEVPKEFEKIVQEVENMSVLQLNELVKVFEAKFGVSATAVATAPQGGGADAGEEKSELNAELTSVGEQKIAVIKAVKEVLGLGLKEAKDLVESAPAMLKEGMKKEDAEALKAKIEEAGGSVELK